MRYFQEDRKCHKIEIVTLSRFYIKVAHVNATVTCNGKMKY
jgi:hypothetical protein